MKQDLIDHPILYNFGKIENYLSWTKYFKTILESAVTGSVVFIVAFVYFDRALGSTGETGDLRADGNMCYGAVVLVVTLKIWFDSNSFTPLVFIFDTLSVGAYWLFVYVMGMFVELDIYHQLPEMHRFKQQFFILFLLGFLSLPFYTLYYSLRKLVFEEDRIA